MIHLRWEKAGRTFIGDKPGTFVYKSSVGQHNVDIGNGQYAPYVWDAQNRIVKFADCELRFTTSGVEFWHGEEKLNILSIHPEYKKGANFQRRTPNIGALSIQEIDSGNSKVELKISYILSTQESETEIFARVGYNRKVHFGTRFKALKDGIEQRICLEFTEKFNPVEERDRQGSILPTARFRTEKTWWTWDRKEQEDHEVEQLENNTKIHLGRKVYALNEEKIITPDTWGTDVGIVANTDDGDETDNTTWNVNGSYSNSDMYGAYGGALEHIGHRWDNITIAKDSTIGSCLLDLYMSSLTSTPTGTYYAWAHDDAPVFAGANRPSTVTKTTASVAFNPTGSAGWKTATLTSILQELVNRPGWVSGNAVNFCAISNSEYTKEAQFEDYNNAGTNEAELTATYTPPVTGYSLTADSIRHSQSTKENDLNQLQFFVVEKTKHSQTVKESLLNQQQILSLESLKHLHTTKEPIFIELSSLIADNSKHSFKSSEPILNQLQILSIDGLKHSQTVLESILNEFGIANLIIENPKHLFTSSEAILSQRIIFIVDNAQHALRVSDLILNQLQVFDIDNVKHASRVTETLLNQLQYFDIDNVKHSFKSVEPVLNQLQIFNIENAQHLFKSEEISLSEIIAFLLLSPDNIQHLQKVSDIDFAILHSLLLQELKHSQRISEPSLNIISPEAIIDTTILNDSDKKRFAQKIGLAISSGTSKKKFIQKTGTTISGKGDKRIYNA